MTDPVIGEIASSLAGLDVSHVPWSGVKVTVCFVGDRPMSMALFDQLSTVVLEEIEPLARVLDGWLIGRHRLSGELVKCHVEDWLRIDDALLDERDQLCGWNGGGRATWPEGVERLRVITEELIPAEHRRVDALSAELSPLPRVLLVD
jgi:hypothetical protein